MRKQITLAEAGDILTTALEGGIGYWSLASEIQREEDLTCISYVLEPACEPDDFEAGVVTRQMVKDAWRKVAEGRTQVEEGSSVWNDMLENSREPGDAGATDSLTADVLVQVALLGEVVFG